jgi:hypothetical protein
VLQYCITCKSEIPSGANSCPACNASSAMPSEEMGNVSEYTVQEETQDALEDTVEGEASGRSGMIWGIGVITVLLALAAAYYFIFLKDDARPPRKIYAETVSAPAAVQAEDVTFYALVKANIRDKPATKESAIIGTKTRGSSVSGQLVTGANPDDKWLALTDGAGFISTVNLSDKAPPRMIKPLGDKLWNADVPTDIWTKLGGGEIIDRVKAGTPLMLAGLVEGDYIEIKLRSGGVGYISGGARIIELMDTPVLKPITMTFIPNSCDFGGGVGAAFAQLAKQQEAKRNAIENRDYPNPDARQDALIAYDQKAEGRSAYAKLNREYKGLTITAIGIHYEYQSVYFDDPPAKVIAAFKQAGYPMKDNGEFQTKDLYAGINAAKNYGKSDLYCGV